ncbi:bifunctional 3-phenylpropionate/cinnamic acid dioxygenase ferredoxin subunit [Streptomyces beihaiensis]|uniref:Bifunctional 3-phenylpropionate/cinnamic acid dioxygenase ferredoxin subunit n=1 Tax=Streptomyces beihaiensis TaxID=2984495 RepID=A0ABT3TSN1_9ACTN|nr:bifunctional 3-phenylpropionate/cinnamic acid dioxygenase ferredoxin subunit [Streptomyces beihaiensis]MCX3059427.1 bifunctional 3-phenylpropionate/cinnamic acid dioxygenase ferredoxin subunit [Streptomyces beihaiensis]
MITVCRIEELPPGESLRITDGVPAPIAVFNADGTIYAVDDTCTHQDASLADGWLEGCFVECPLHTALFDLRTGMPTCAPAKTPVRTHQVSVENGHILLHISVGEPA